MCNVSSIYSFHFLYKVNNAFSHNLLLLTDLFIIFYIIHNSSSILLTQFSRFIFVFGRFSGTELRPFNIHFEYLFKNLLFIEKYQYPITLQYFSKQSQVQILFLNSHFFHRISLFIDWGSPTDEVFLRKSEHYQWVNIVFKLLIWK